MTADIVDVTTDIVDVTTDIVDVTTDIVDVMSDIVDVMSDIVDAATCENKLPDWCSKFCLTFIPFHKKSDTDANFQSFAASKFVNCELRKRCGSEERASLRIANCELRIANWYEN